MIGFIRLAVFGFIGLTVLYFLVSIYSRSTRREELERRGVLNKGRGIAMGLSPQAWRNMKRACAKS